MHNNAALLSSPKISVHMNMSEEDINEVIHLAWCDKTSFDEIRLQYGLREPEVKALMRTHLKRSSFKLWRKRVYGRQAKHSKLLRPKSSKVSPQHRKDT